MRARTSIGTSSPSSLQRLTRTDSQPHQWTLSLHHMPLRSRCSVTSSNSTLDASFQTQMMLKLRTAQTPVQLTTMAVINLGSGLVYNPPAHRRRNPLPLTHQSKPNTNSPLVLLPRKVFRKTNWLSSLMGHASETRTWRSSSAQQVGAQLSLRAPWATHLSEAMQ